MRLLLDTHVFIWYVTDHPSLSRDERSIIDDGNNIIFLSIASVWEMAIKYSIGKLYFDLPFREFIDEQLTLNKIDLLNISFNHVKVVSDLPLHHRDPFDRLIIAQAMVEMLPILSQDSIFDLYPIQRLS